MILIHYPYSYHKISIKEFQISLFEFVHYLMNFKIRYFFDASVSETVKSLPIF
jgi:hypothetical protein